MSTKFETIIYVMCLIFSLAMVVFMLTDDREPPENTIDKNPVETIEFIKRDKYSKHVSYIQTDTEHLVINTESIQFTQAKPGETLSFGRIHYAAPSLFGDLPYNLNVPENQIDIISKKYETAFGEPPEFVDDKPDK